MYNLKNVPTYLLGKSKTDNNTWSIYYVERVGPRIEVDEVVYSSISKVEVLDIYEELIEDKSNKINSFKNN